MTFSEVVQTFWDEFVIFILVLLLTRYLTRMKKELGENYDHLDWNLFIPGSVLLLSFIISTGITVNAFFTKGIANMGLNGSHLFVWFCCYLYSSKDITGLLNAISRFFDTKMKTILEAQKTLKNERETVNKKNLESSEEDQGEE